MSVQHSDAGRRRPLQRDGSNAPSMDRASEQRIEVDVSMHATGPQPVSPQLVMEDELDNLEWARSKQQREMEARVNRLPPQASKVKSGGVTGSCMNQKLQ